MSTTRGQHLLGKVIGSCVLEKLLGYGGTSAVFLGQQQESEQKVAVKVFLPRSNMDARMQRDFYLRFLQEAEAASKLDHPNILPINSYGEQDGLPFIIMPYMEGGTLSEYAAQHGCLLLSEAQWYLAQIASALDYAHEQGCVHCDVKPANILLDSDGQAMLSDFGIARLMQPVRENRNANGSGRAATKEPEILMGTPDYISPEQALALPLDGRSDMYSLGITLFYLLAGRLPFKADLTIAVALLQVHEQPPLLGPLRADISPQIDAVIQKALAKKPEDRFQTVTEFSVAFDQAIAASEITYQPGADHNQERQRFDSEDRAVRVGREDDDHRDSSLAEISLPVVRVKPVMRHSMRFWHLLLAVAIVFMLVVGLATTAGVIISRLTPDTPIIQATVPAGNALVDDLADNSNWPTDDNKFFSGQHYYIQNTSSQYVALALYATHSYHDFQLTVNMSEVKGPRNGADYYGIVFRSNDLQTNYYLFEVVSWGGGQYQFLRYNGQYKTLAGGPAPSLVTGIGKINTVTIVAQGNTFSFLINGKPVGSTITDSSKRALPTGEIGLYVEGQGTEVAFSHLYIKTEV